MSIPVELDVLEAKTHEYGWAYLLTVGDDLRPKIVACPPEWHDGVMCFAAGGGSARNSLARPSVTVTFPPLEPDGYTLIVDGDATVDETGESPRVHVAPSERCSTACAGGLHQHRDRLQSRMRAGRLTGVRQRLRPRRASQPESVVGRVRVGSRRIGLVERGGTSGTGCA